MTRDLSRLFIPRSIAVLGSGAWCASVIAAARRLGFSGPIVPVRPAGKVIAGLRSVTTIHAIPDQIDTAFVGVNRRASVESVAGLAALGAYVLTVSHSQTAKCPETSGLAAPGMTGPPALKSLGLAYKSEQGGVRLYLTPDAIAWATSRIMGEVFAGFRNDPDLRVAILTGAGWSWR